MNSFQITGCPARNDTSFTLSAVTECLLYAAMGGSKEVLELLSPGLERTGSFCFLPVGTRPPCSSHMEENQGATVDSPIVLSKAASANGLPRSTPSWMFQPN